MGKLSSHNRFSERPQRQCKCARHIWPDLFGKDMAKYAAGGRRRMEDDASRRYVFLLWPSFCCIFSSCSLYLRFSASLQSSGCFSLPLVSLPLAPAKALLPA